MTTELGTEGRPLRVAIVGAGPSGFYAADALFRSSLIIHVDAFDKLSTPYGLLRGGVAPDHQKMKSVSAYYDRVASKFPDRFRFIGNVEIGKDLTLDELREHYDAVVFSYGSSSDQKTGLPGEELPGVYSAREFVGWYNGHPDYQHFEFDLNQEVVSIIGQGNVAIDVARILAKTPDELKVSDITQKALDTLSKSKVKEIHIIGRRGPVQSAFTELEAKELGELDDANIVVYEEDLVLDEANRREMEEVESNKARKNYAVLQELAKKPKEGKSKKVFIQYFKYPKEILGATKAEGLKMDVVRLEGEAFKQKAIPTGQEFTVPSGLIFRSIGYKGTSIEGLPFDNKRGVIPNQKGRVTDNDGNVVSGFYTAGWIKRGPSGVLGSNKPCSAETIDCLFEDLPNLSLCKTPSSEPLLTKLQNKGIRTVSFDDWKIIDQQETELGKAKGKPREKFTSSKEIFAALDALVKKA